MEDRKTLKRLLICLEDNFIREYGTLDLDQEKEMARDIMWFSEITGISIRQESMSYFHQIVRDIS